MTNYENHKAFSKAFREALIAYAFDFGGIVAGFLVAYYFNVFQSYPWAIAVYPTILSARGMISGLFSGRLGTALHLGTVYPKFFGNTKSFYVLFDAVIVITLGTSIFMSCVSILFGSAFWGISSHDFFDIFAVVVSTMTFGLILSFFTMGVGFTAFKKGLDPDVIEYPIMSTAADIFITVCYLFVLVLYKFFKYAVVLVIIFHVLLTLYLLLRDFKASEFIKTLKESLATLIIVAFIINITGTVLNRISIIVEGRKEIYSVYPALIDAVGDVGSVVGSTATTKLALGLLKPSFSAMRNHSQQIFAAWTSAVVYFILFSALSLSLNNMLSLSAFLGFTALLLTANLIAVSTIILTSYAVAILTFQRGLDPDNFVIPIESSLADSITTIALLAALFLVG
ncbi:MAG: magnesium transporter [Candidatus Bathyarchaeota archaeon]|nr:magnesium transporter [Candidatus Bathyarchaeota archaeon]